MFEFNLFLHFKFQSLFLKNKKLKIESTFISIFNFKYGRDFSPCNQFIIIYLTNFFSEKKKKRNKLRVGSSCPKSITALDHMTE